jgi:hypothetical protein
MIDRDEPLPVALVDSEEADPLITWFSEDEMVWILNTMSGSWHL